MSAHRRRRRGGNSSSGMKRGFDVAHQSVGGGNGRRRGNSSSIFMRLGTSVVGILKWIFLGILLVSVIAAVGGGVWLFFAFSHRTINENTIKNIVIYPSEKNESKNEYLIANIDFKTGSFFVLKRPTFSTIDDKSLTLYAVAKDTGILADELWRVDNSAVFTSKGPEQLAWRLTQLKGQTSWTLGDRWWSWWRARGFRNGRIGWFESGAENSAISTWLTAVQPLPEAATCSFAVLNATATSGAAAQVSGQLEKNHLVVVRVDGNDKMLEHTQLLIDSEYAGKCAQIVERVQRNLPDSSETKKLDNIYQNYRAPLVILVGENVK